MQFVLPLQHRCLVNFLLIFGIFITDLGAETSDEHKSETSPKSCDQICGCDKLIIYDDASGKCVRSFKHLMFSKVTQYNPLGYTINNDRGMAKSVRLEAENMFKPILISLILFIICAVISIGSACFYCYWMNQTDCKLKNEIKAMAKKLQRYPTLKSPETNPSASVAKSCFIVCEDASVNVV